MPAPLRVVLWNTNGLLSHKLELQAFLDMHKIDIDLISETHFTSRTVFKLPHYTIYHIIHPDNTAHEGVAIILRSSLRQYNYYITYLKLCRPQPSDSIFVHAP